MKGLIWLALAASCCFGAPPDLNGVWRLDVESSDFDRQAPPRMAVDRFVHNEPDLVIHSTRAYGDAPEATGILRYNIGGEGDNDVMGNRMHYRATWDGPVLEIVTTGSFGDNAIVLTDRYEMSVDGKTLTLKRHYEGRGGPQDQTMILRREK